MSVGINFTEFSSSGVFLQILYPIDRGKYNFEEYARIEIGQHNEDIVREIKAPKWPNRYRFKLWNKHSGFPVLIEEKDIAVVATTEDDALDFGGRHAFAPGETITARVQMLKDRYFTEGAHLYVTPLGNGPGRTQIIPVGNALPREIQFEAPHTEGKYVVWLIDRSNYEHEPFEVDREDFEVQATLFIVNGSFEYPGSVSKKWTTHFTGDMSVDGWVVGSGSVDRVRDVQFEASDGSYSVDLDGSSVGSIYQDIVGLVVGKNYKVSFDMAGNPQGGPLVKQLIVSAGDESKTFTFDTSGRSGNAMGWVTHEFSFSAESETERLMFSSMTSEENKLFEATAEGVRVEIPIISNGNLFGPMIDNVRIE